ncbi:competence pheromone ComX [Lederbergia sp. NSJ-179]|uniref:competence pheromone ComX n=1 Tax=Lederbergia sp. NSJ-179 TaxID=2931402 RepID=UPI001FD50AA3|nr:competence pheromone ComX [Lederbergia sp. NSJ-179]MCJ7841742.1 competence pheromone ComX [Lederbergia sp. NSJ-179]
MQNMIQFLSHNSEVLNKVKEGTASLLGINPEEKKAILDVFFDGGTTPEDYYWK